MAYEFLIATGTDPGADADEKLEMALVYLDDNNEEQVSDYFQPGDNSNRDNAYENGQLDVCSNISVTKEGQEIITDKFTAVMVKYYDNDWQLHTIWVTDTKTGRYRWKEVKKFFGNKHDEGTVDNPYRIELEDEGKPGITVREHSDFTFTVSTQDVPEAQTNDTVLYKIFDKLGYSSITQRKEQWGNQYERGETNVLRGFDTVFGDLDADIVKVLIVKVGGNMWKPQNMEVAPTALVGNTSNRFDLASSIPPDGLDTHHNWVLTPKE